jgi:hypothetical protein
MFYKYYKEGNRFFWIDYVLSAIIAYLALFVCPNSLQNDFLVSLSSVSGALLGFMIAAFSIVGSAMSERSFSLLREGGHHIEIIRLYKSAIFHLSIVTILSLALISIDLQNISILENISILDIIKFILILFVSMSAFRICLAVHVVSLVYGIRCK